MSSRLRSGTILGHYRIVAPLGSGGMGEVFKAHDTKLDRAVALKVLPADVVRDPERVRRFVQEAKAASSLSHPNIVTIHDIGHAVPREEGAAEPAPDAEAIHYIAMELVEGSTLRQLLEEKSTDLRTLLAYLAQAAEGLAKAHAAGIVHRDLKPENVMVTRDGYAKVLDFGLAKLTESGATGSMLAAAPTALDQENTREGAVLGTVGYMSPEQVQGKKVDHRTDLFAFGCLLYEAATGRKPFAGDSSVDIMHAILREQPPPVEELNPQAPRVLVRTIRRCLAKEPERRFQSMKDLALELHEMVEEWATLATPSGPVSSATAYSGAAPAAPRGLGKTAWIAIGAAVVVALLAIVVAVRARGTASSPTGASSFQSMRITPLTANGHVLGLAISPDGKYLAYSRIDAPGVSLWVRQVTTGSDVQVLSSRSPDKPITAVRFTPDGDYIDYLRTTEDPRLPQNLWELHRIPTLGGPPRKIVGDIDTPPAYSPDGKQIAFVRFDPAHWVSNLLVAGADGSGERVLASRARNKGSAYIVNNWGLGPEWSPDGRKIAVPVTVYGRSAPDGIALVDAATGEDGTLGDFATRDLDAIAWARDGRSLLVVARGTGAASNSQIWRVSSPDGAVSRLTNDLSQYSGLSLTADGRALATIQYEQPSELWSVPLDRSDAAPKALTTGTKESFVALDSAADGTIIAALQRGAEQDLWRISSSSGERVQLTHGSAARNPQISRDGRVVAYVAASPDGETNLYAMDGDGGNARELGRSGGEFMPTISPDGRWIAFQSAEQPGIWQQPTGGGEAKLLIADPQAWNPRFSPDGTKLLYCTTRNAPDRPPGQGRNVLVVIPAGGGGPLAEVERPQAGEWKWAPDQKSALFEKIEGDGNNLWRLPLDGSPAQPITRFQSTQMIDFTLVDGGKTLVFSRAAGAGDAVLITNFE
jgi:serine/threonine protein kinase